MTDEQMTPTTTEFDADAYLRYMMGGTAAAAVDDTVSAASPQQPSPQSITSPQKRANTKQYASIVKAFQGTYQRDWLEVDDNLGAVMRSISNLRDRIYWTSEQLVKQQQQSEAAADETTNRSALPKRRSIASARVHLTRDDMELALQHDLQQHEQMMVGARSLISNLNQAQEALGRRLDEAMQYNLEFEYYDEASSSFQSNNSMAMEQVYQELARALYQKQLLVVHVLTCTNNRLLMAPPSSREQSSGSGPAALASVIEDDEPRTAAQTCIKKWTRPQVQELWSLYS
mmetsp:Transcript_28299/g.46846  ORF Transcript_28299/g.46846 Transcript_28299/m.46846 type:complete len:287 (+) Transcript_28299:393-1253(+)